MTRRTPPLPSLTGIRGFAAAWVVLYHMEILGSLRLPLVRDGFRGVDLFFLLSGFIMMHAHQGDFGRLTGRKTLRFLALRCIRVYPLNTAVLLLIVPIVAACPAFVTWYRHRDPVVATAFSTVGFFQTLLLANRWFIRDMGEWNGPTWSLSVEFIAYLTFPLFAWLLNRENSRLRCALYASGLLGFLIAFELATHSDGNIFGRLALLRALTCFPAGVASYRFCALSQDSSADAAKAARLAVLSCVALLACLLVPHMAAFVPFCFAILLGSLFYQHGAVNALLSGRLSLFLGDISFPLYLFHWIPLIFLQWEFKSGKLSPTTLNFIWSSGTFLCMVVVVSQLLHRFVETPSGRQGRRMLDHHLKSD